MSNIGITPVSQVQQLNPIDGSFTVFLETDFENANFGKSTYNTAAAVIAANGSHSGGNMLAEQPIITESTLTPEGNKIEIQSMKQAPTPNKPAQGEMRIANGFQALLTQYGVEELLRGVCQDPNPTATYRGGGAKPAEHTLVAVSALGSQSTPVNHTIVAIPNTFKFGVKIKATLSASPALSSSAVAGFVEITGKDLNGNVQTDKLRWTAGSLSPLVADMETNRYFDPTQAITVKSYGFSAGSVTVKVDDPSRTLTFTPHRFPDNYLSYEVNIGGKDALAVASSVFSQMQFGVAMDTVIGNFGVMSPYGIIKQNIKGEALPSGSNTPTPLSTGVERTKAPPYTGVESYLEIGGEKVAMTSIEVDIMLGFYIPFYHAYSVWPEAAPARNALRTYRVTATLPYDAREEFQANYLQNDSIEDVHAVLASGAKGTFGAYQSDLRFEMFKGVQMQMPSFQGTGVTPGTQQIIIQAYTDGSEADFQIVSNQPKQTAFLYNNS